MAKSRIKQSERREARDPATSPERLAELAKSDVALARLVAANEGAPGEMLAELGEHGDRAVRRHVVRNPATPAQTAARAGSEFPNDLLDNPAFDLYMIEQPDLLSEFGEATFRALLKRDRCPISFFSYAAESGDPATALALLSNAAVPNELIDKLRYQDLGYSGSKSRVLEACDLHHANGNSDIDWRSILAGAVAEARLSSLTWVRPPLAALARLAYAAGDPDADLISPIIEGVDPRIPELQRKALATPGGRAGRARSDEGTTSELLRQLIETVDVCSAIPLLGNPDAAPLWTVETLAAALRCLSPPSSVDPQHWKCGWRTWNQELRHGDWDHLPADLLASLPLPEFAEAAAIGLKRLPVLPDNVEPYLNYGPTRKAIASHTSASADLLERLVELEPRAVASNPAAPAELLYRLSDTEAWAIAENPSSPPALLFQLAKSAGENLKAAVEADPNYLGDCPRIGTPAYFIWRDSHPAAFGRAITTRADASLELLLELAAINDAALAMTLVERRDASADLLAILARSNEAEIRRKVASHSNTDGSTLAILAADPDPGAKGQHRYEDQDPVRAIVAANQNTPPEALAFLANDLDSGWQHFDRRGRPDRCRLPIGQLAAANPAIANVNLDRQVRISDQKSLNHLAGNASVTDDGQGEMLDKIPDQSDASIDDHWRMLAEHGDWSVLRWASNYSTPEYRRNLVHRIFAQHSDEWKRSALADERLCSPELLEKLASDDATRVREAVAKNVCAPVTPLTRLAADDDGDVRAAVAANRQTPPATLLEMFDNEVKRASRESEHPWRQQLDLQRVHVALSGNRNAPETALEKLSASENLQVLMALAKNAIAPVRAKLRALETLARCADGPEGKKAILFAAAHRLTPRPILDEMLRSSDFDISRRARANPALAKLRRKSRATTVKTRPLDAERIERALDSADPATAVAALRAEWLDNMARPNQPSLSRLTAFLLPDCPPARLAKAQRSGWWPERCAIASHPKTPLSAVRRLADDGNMVVRAAAREELERRKLEAEI